MEWDGVALGRRFPTTSPIGTSQICKRGAVQVSQAEGRLSSGVGGALPSHPVAPVGSW